MGNCLRRNKPTIVDNKKRSNSLSTSQRDSIDDKTNDLSKKELISNSKDIQMQCTSHSDCLSIDRIKRLMQLYVTNNKLSFISQFQIDNLTSILNDYHHIINFHGNDNDLEQLSHSLQCDLKSCEASIRNVRDRAIDNNVSNTYNINEKVLIHLFDTMHCHLFHSFDTAFRLTQNEKNQIDSHTHDDKKLNFIKVTNIINIKRNKIYVRDQQRTTYNKFQTKVNHDNDSNEQKEKKEKSLSTYSFGMEFNYWNDQHPLYVKPKYLSFKQEITSNIIHPIPVSQWNETHQKAQQFIKCQYSKSLKNTIWHPFKQRTFGYDLKRGEQISISHLMAIIFYTDFSVLSYKLSETFRKCNVSQSINDLIQINSNFCWFSKLIKETVNCFGTTNKDHKWEYYYHGISKAMIFNSTTACFNHPTSTTKQLNVACIFSGTDGIILNIMKIADFRCFDCCWISAYSNEDETLFTSGQKPRNELIIINIINCSSSEQYEPYIHALNQLIMRVAPNRSNSQQHYTHPANATSKDTLILDKLLNMNSACISIPKYFNQIFKSYQLNTKELEIEIDLICVVSESEYFLNLLSSEDGLFVNLDNIETMYPNVEQIKFWGSVMNSSYPNMNRITLSKSYLNFVALELKKYAPSSLNKIIIVNIEYNYHKEIFDLLQSTTNLFEQQTKFTLEWKKSIAELHIKRLNM